MSGARGARPAADAAPHVELATQELGAGPPVVILHGLLGSGTNWRPVARRLAEGGRRVVLADLRNHGRSPHAPAMDYATQAADVRALLDRLGLERPALVGHSMGGKTAMRLALEHPERVAHLCVVDIAPVPSRGAHEPVLEAMARLALDAIGERGDADRRLAAEVPDPALRAFVLQNLQRTGGGWRWRVGLDEIRAALPDLLDFPRPPGAVYGGPTLVVRGARSDYVRDEDWPAFAEPFPGARLVTVPEAGHWVHAERPAAFLAAVDRFLPRAA